MYWFGFIVGGLIVGTLVAIAAMLYIVIGGLTRTGEYRTQWGELVRQRMGLRYANAEPRREARRQVEIKREMARIEEQGR